MPQGYGYPQHPDSPRATQTAFVPAGEPRKLNVEGTHEGLTAHQAAGYGGGLTAKKNSSIRARGSADDWTAQSRQPAI